MDVTPTAPEPKRRKKVEPEPAPEPIPEALSEETSVALLEASRSQSSVSMIQIALQMVKNVYMWKKTLVVAFFIILTTVTLGTDIYGSMFDITKFMIQDTTSKQKPDTLSQLIVTRSEELSSTTPLPFPALYNSTITLSPYLSIEESSNIHSIIHSELLLR